jgi:hypothetical protein
MSARDGRGDLHHVNVAVSVVGSLDVHVALIEVEQAECRADTRTTDRPERLAHRLDQVDRLDIKP